MVYSDQKRAKFQDDTVKYLPENQLLMSRKVAQVHVLFEKCYSVNLRQALYSSSCDIPLARD